MANQRYETPQRKDQKKGHINRANTFLDDFVYEEIGGGFSKGFSIGFNRLSDTIRFIRRARGFIHSPLYSSLYKQANQRP